MIRDPVLIIGCPRSGTSLLYNVLSAAPELWSIGYESKAIIEADHSPAAKGWESGALQAVDLTPLSRERMLNAFSEQAAPGSFWRRLNHLRRLARDAGLTRRLRVLGSADKPGAATASAVPQGALDSVRTLIRWRSRLIGPSSEPIRLLEKTPENCLRLPFLQALFPDARVIYLVRDGRANVNSLMEGWRQPYLFPGYKVPAAVAIPGITRSRWAFTLIPGWRDLLHSPLEEVCAWQWLHANQAVLDYFDTADNPLPVLTVHYESLINQPANTLARIAEFITIEYAGIQPAAEQLPRINVVSDPDQEKWRQQNPDEIARVLPLITPLMRTLGY